MLQEVISRASAPLSYETKPPVVSWVTATVVPPQRPRGGFEMEGEQNNADVGSKGMCYKTPYDETEMNAAGLGLHPLWRSCCGVCCGGCRNYGINDGARRAEAVPTSFAGHQLPVGGTMVSAPNLALYSCQNHVLQMSDR